MAGGAIKFDSDECMVSANVKFVHNSAIYGGEIGSYPIVMRRIDNST
jgi:hypothetical protein